MVANIRKLPYYFDGNCTMTSFIKTLVSRNCAKISRKSSENCCQKQDALLHLGVYKK